MREKPWFERKFDDNLLARDLTLIGFAVFGFGIPFKFLLEFTHPIFSISIFTSLVVGVLFAVLWLSVMEVVMRISRDSSIFRYFLGGDPFKEEQN